MDTFETNCKQCNRLLKGNHCVFLPTLSTYVICDCGFENVVPLDRGRGYVFENYDPKDNGNQGS